jgi:hypothetical protein
MSHVVITPASSSETLKRASKLCMVLRGQVNLVQAMYSVKSHRVRHDGSCGIRRSSEQVQAVNEDGEIDSKFDTDAVTNVFLEQLSLETNSGLVRDTLLNDYKLSLSTRCCKTYLSSFSFSGYNKEQRYGRKKAVT